MYRSSSSQQLARSTETVRSHQVYQLSEGVRGVAVISYSYMYIPDCIQNYVITIALKCFLVCHNPSPFSLGYRTSVASSTDTGDEHDTDIEDPTPLPPPRPRHWARRAKEQSMAPESNSGKLTEEQSNPDDPSSPSDWSKSVPQFPLPTFKPTIQSTSLPHISEVLLFVLLLLLC